MAVSDPHGVSQVFFFLFVFCLYVIFLSLMVVFLVGLFLLEGPRWSIPT